MKLVLTCEHAFPDIPEKYQDLFKSVPEVLKTHEAYDPGAFDLLQDLKVLADSTSYQKIGRLLVESNRSLWHKNLFSKYSENLSDKDKNDILYKFYRPYRTEVEDNIGLLIDDGNKVFHISIHSFTPNLKGEERNCDIGLLYDPGKQQEKEISAKWKNIILNLNPEKKVRFNYPYLGKADGFTTSLRKKFPEYYIGIELEVNQKWVIDNKMEESLKRAIFASLKELKREA